MKPTWHRVNATIFGRSHDPGTLSLFFDYNLLNWTFGICVQPDNLWTTVYIELGPIVFDFTYWRIEAANAGSVR